MSFEEPTYEEYKEATEWARFKYKYGMVVQVLAWLCFVFIIFYMVSNGEAIARHPLIYGADKYNVTCTCYSEDGTPIYINSSRISSGPYINMPENLSELKEVEWENKTS